MKKRGRYRAARAGLEEDEVVEGEEAKKMTIFTHVGNVVSVQQTNEIF